MSFEPTEVRNSVKNPHQSIWACTYDHQEPLGYFVILLLWVGIAIVEQLPQLRFEGVVTKDGEALISSPGDMAILYNMVSENEKKRMLVI